MKMSRFFVTLLLIGGLFLMVSSSSMAENRFTIDKESIQSIIDQSMNGAKGFKPDGYTEIAWKVKLQNSSDEPLAFDVTVAFVNSEKDKLGEATKTCKIKPGESKMVSNLILLDSTTAKQIDSGYVSIEKAENVVVAEETHSIVATVGDGFKENVADISDKYIKIDYNVKLRNKSDKPVTSDLTIAFLDENNVKIGEGRARGSFEAGELKTITDTIVLRTSDASRIASSHVTIQK